MAIIAEQTAPNFATGNYHRILKTEYLCSPSEPIPRYHHVVGFYASEYARDTNPNNPLWTRSVYVTLEQILARGGVDPRNQWYVDIMQDELFAGTNAVGDVATA